MMATIYDRIRELRAMKGMTQDDLAKAMGYKDRSMITKIEGGKVDISQKKLEKFAEVLGTTSAYLMGWEEKEELPYLNIHDLVNNAVHAGMVMQKRIDEDNASTIPEIHLVSSAMARMTQEQREQVVNVLRAVFASNPELFK